MDIEKVKIAYQFAIEQCKRAYRVDPIAYGHLTTLAALAHVYLLQEKENPDAIVNEILGEDE